MRERRKLLSGALVLLLWVNVVSSQWTTPYFVVSETANKNVTWIYNYDRIASLNIWEGTEGNAELLRLSYTGTTKPAVTYSGSRGLDLNIDHDENTQYPYFLQTSEPGDYESGIIKFDILVQPEDAASGQVTVTLVNVNDNPPVIESPAECNVEELFVGLTDCKFVVTDQDGGACYAKMTVDDKHFEFELEGQPSGNCKTGTFILKVVEALDFETFRLHSLRIEAEDTGQVDTTTTLPGGTLYGAAAFVVTVVDLPDEPPVWQQFVPSVSEDEKTEWSRQLKAVDGDFGLNWDIRYELLFDPEDEELFLQYFSIDDNDGTLTGRSLDRDELKKEIYRMQVVATEKIPDDYNGDREGLPMNITSDIVVLINDINDNLPLVEPKLVELDVDEETFFTCKNFTVSDPDLADQGSFDLSLEENEFSDNFLLIPMSGYQEAALTITPLNTSLLDYEDPDWRVIRLKIVATEIADNSHTSFGELVINLIDLNDEYPVFSQEEYEVEIPENQPADVSVVQTNATDADYDDVITFSISNRYLKIDQTGLITTIGDNAFDYERQTEIILQVVASDKVNHRSYALVNITVIDLNDEPPTLVMPAGRFDIDEHADVGSVASENITATDPDAGAQLNFTINWEKSAAYKQGVQLQDRSLYEDSVVLAETIEEEGVNGRVWITYLKIANNETFDWEVFDTMRLQIVVADLDTLLPDYEHNYEREALLTVDVGDINDCAPVFTNESLTAVLAVFENSSVVRLVGAMAATDDDGDGNNVISYFIRPVFPEGLMDVEEQLVIDERTGQLRTVGEEHGIIDAEQFREEEYRFEVIASDTVFNTTLLINVTILDINDCPPEVKDPEDLVLLADFEEHLEGSWELGCIETYDDDMTDPYNRVVYILRLDAKSQEFFEMRNNCLWVIEGSGLDREIDASHEMTVLTRDNFEDKLTYDSIEGDTVSINVNLIDINDKAPTFVPKELPVLYEKMVEANQLLFYAEVTDEDEGENARIICDPVPDVVSTPVRPEVVFRVETVQQGFGKSICNVYTTEPLIYNWAVYEILIKAFDNGTEPQHGNLTYTLTVENDNLHPPVFVYPVKGEPIKIGRDQILNSLEPLKTVDMKDVPYFYATDEDDVENGNGRVNMVLEDDTFGLEPYDTNTYRLIMKRYAPSDTRIFTLTVVAEDNPKVSSDKNTIELEFQVYVISLNTYPTFEIQEQNVSFSENSTGKTENATLLEARNLDEELLGEGRNIYYYLIGGDVEYFNLERSTGLLTVKENLEYQKAQQHSLEVIASHDEEAPAPGGNYGTSVLYVTVEVIDINDQPPQFSADIFLGTFRKDYAIGEKLLTIEAVDPDTGDEVTYLMVKGSITTESESLKEFANDDSFLVDSKTGAVTLNFSPGNRDLVGHFTFDVLAHDEAGNVPGHTDEAQVKIYVVSDVHQVRFHFLNRVDVVETKEKEMEQVFSDVFKYQCSVDSIQQTDESEFETTVVTHFFNEQTSEAVESNAIEDQFLQADTYVQLASAMQDLSLSFSGFRVQSEQEAEAGSYMTIVLAAVCVVLGVLVVVFSLAFVVRTRSLNQRLDKLTSKKFGSQDSGLNRDIMAVPGTNRHALEGSNPVWNREIDESFDNISQSSGDSGLIGIEDSPEFGGAGSGVENKGYELPEKENFTVQSETPLPNARRVSINPLAAAAMAEDDMAFSEPDPVTLEDLGMPRRISLNPLAGGLDIHLDADLDDDVEAGLDTEVDIDGGPSNANFSFQNPEPTTEL